MPKTYRILLTGMQKLSGGRQSMRGIFPSLPIPQSKCASFHCAWCQECGRTNGLAEWQWTRHKRETGSVCIPEDLINGDEDGNHLEECWEWWVTFCKDRLV